MLSTFIHVGFDWYLERWGYLNPDFCGFWWIANINHSPLSKRPGHMFFLYRNWRLFDKILNFRLHISQENVVLLQKIKYFILFWQKVRFHYVFLFAGKLWSSHSGLKKRNWFPWFAYLCETFKMLSNGRDLVGIGSMGSTEPMKPTDVNTLHWENH